MCEREIETDNTASNTESRAARDRQGRQTSMQHGRKSNEEGSSMVVSTAAAGDEGDEGHSPCLVPPVMARTLEVAVGAWTDAHVGGCTNTVDSEARKQMH